LSPIPLNVKPGHALPIVFYWRGSAAPEHWRYQLRIVDPKGHIWREVSGEPALSLRLEESPSPILIAEPLGLYFPPDAVVGRYTFEWRLFIEDKPVLGRSGWRPWLSAVNRLGAIQVEPWPIERKLPQTDMVMEATFGSTIQLYGYDLRLDENDVYLTLYWRAAAQPEDSYYVFVHLMDEVADVLAAQQDRIPNNWLRPTNGGRSGELIRDESHFLMPPTTTGGEWRFYVGLYDRDNGQRLPVVFEEIPQADHRLSLIPFTLP
jgi:hypothetical protein